MKRNYPKTSTTKPYNGEREAGTSENHDKLLSVKVVAIDLNVSDDAVRKLISSGRLPARKDGRRWGIYHSKLVEYKRSKWYYAGEFTT